MTAAFDPTVPAPNTRGPFDAALMLRDGAAAAITSTSAETAIALGVRTVEEFYVVINVSALDHTTGDETYTITVETDSAVAFPSATTVASLTVTATGTYELPLTGPFIAQTDPTAAAIRVKATLGGTTPILKYGAWIAADV